MIRPGWVYGNRGGTAMMYGSAKEHGAARTVGDGTNRWTTVHADDLADLDLLALEKAPAASTFNGAGLFDAVGRRATQDDFARQGYPRGGAASPAAWRSRARR